MSEFIKLQVHHDQLSIVSLGSVLRTCALHLQLGRESNLTSTHYKHVALILALALCAFNCSNLLLGVIVYQVLGDNLGTTPSGSASWRLERRVA